MSAPEVSWELEESGVGANGRHSNWRLWVTAFYRHTTQKTRTRRVEWCFGPRDRVPSHVALVVLSVDRRTLYDWIEAGKLRAKVEGGEGTRTDPRRYRIEARDLWKRWWVMAFPDHQPPWERRKSRRKKKRAER